MYKINLFQLGICRLAIFSHVLVQCLYRYEVYLHVHLEVLVCVDFHFITPVLLK